MFKSNLVATIQVNGIPLREFGSNVYLPYDTEYQIMLKNKTILRQAVRVTIAGESMWDGSIVLNGRETFDYGNFNRNNKFKFKKLSENGSHNYPFLFEDCLIIIRFVSETVPIMDLDMNKKATYNKTGFTPNVSDWETVWPDSEETMFLKLNGEFKHKQIVEPITVKTKIECKSCGTKNPAGFEYCSTCGDKVIFN
jgi:hypothetical protein